MNLRETTEDYLEKILIIRNEQGYVRSVDIAEIMKVSKPSVTYATKKLKEKRLISMDNNNMISLTDKGEKIANDTWTRHNTLAAFFESLGVKKNQALEDACKVEHDLSEETFTAIKKFVNKNGW